MSRKTDLNGRRFGGRFAEVPETGGVAFGNPHGAQNSPPGLRAGVEQLGGIFGRSVGIDQDVDVEVAAAFGPLVGLLGEHDGPRKDSVPGTRGSSILTVEQRSFSTPLMSVILPQRVRAWGGYGVLVPPHFGGCLAVRETGDL